MLKYADEALPAAIRAIEEKGGRRGAMKAKIAGGSRMFDLGEEHQNDIGRRNVAAVREILERLEIPLVAEDTGGTKGRTVEFCVESGVMVIRTFDGDERFI